MDDNNPPAEITTEQRFSIKGLRYITDNIEDPEWIRDNEVDAESIKTIKTLGTRYQKQKHVSTYGKQTIVYKHSTPQAKLRYGRMYGSSGSLERLHRPLRHILLADFYHDIDIKNAHPVILVQIAKLRYNYDLPEVQKYCDNRDEYLKLVSGNRDVAKQGVLQAIFLGNPIPAFMPMKNEILAFAIYLYNKGEYSDLFPLVSQTNIFGSYLSMILQTFELSIMIAMKTAFESNGYSVDILAYDGVMLRKVKGNDPTEELLRKVEQDILTNTKLNVELTIKPMKSPLNEDDNDKEILPLVSYQQYNDMKERFEKRHFYFTPTDTIGWYHEKTGELSFITKQHAQNLFVGSEWFFKGGDTFANNIQFFPLWFKDSNRRNVSRIDYAESSEQSVFVRPLLMKYKQVQPPSPKGLQYFNELVDIVTNHNADLKHYLLAYLAHMLQKPFELPDKALVLTGAKRIGKDTLMNFIGEHIIGKTYFQNYDSNKQFFNDYDTGCDGKFMVKLEEADTNLCRQYADKLKTRITATSVSFNPKGKSAYDSPNYTRYIFTTNKANPFDLSDGEQRYVIFACSPEKKGDVGFFNNVREHLYNDSAGYSVAQFLLKYDISKWNPRVLPKNEYQNNIVELEMTVEERFLQSEIWNGDAITTQDLFNMYKEFTIDNQLPHKLSTMSFAKAIQPFVRDKVLTYTRDSKKIGYYKKI